MIYNSLGIKKRGIFIDCTHVYFFGGNTGIQRVVKGIIKNCRKVGIGLDMECRPVIWRGEYFVEIEKIPSKREFLRKLEIFLRRALTKIHPISKLLIPKKIRWYAKKIIKISVVALLSLKLLFKKRVDFRKNDILLLADSFWDPLFTEGVQLAQKNGAKVGAIIYDLIPIRYPQFCDKNLVGLFNRAIKEILPLLDFCASISDSTKKDLLWYLNTKNLLNKETIKLFSFPLGADFNFNKSEETVRNSIMEIFQNPSGQKPYISVCTIEPRKNHNYILDSFENIWSRNRFPKLCLIGKIGWLCNDLLKRIKNNPQLGKSLYMFNDLNDAELLFCYKHSKALISASITEGFDLPVIEALNYKLPVLASDITIHREICKNSCSYFGLSSTNDLVKLIEDLETTKPTSRNEDTQQFYWPNWEESTKILFTKLNNLYE